MAVNNSNSSKKHVRWFRRAAIEVRVCKGCEAASRGAGAKTRRGERGRRGEVSSTIAERENKIEGRPDFILSLPSSLYPLLQFTPFSIHRSREGQIT